jgi:hypothetical protein
VDGFLAFAMMAVLAAPFLVSTFLLGRWQHNAMQSRQLNRRSLVNMVIKVVRCFLLAWLIATGLFLLQRLFADEAPESSEYYVLIICLLGPACLSFSSLSMVLLIARRVFGLPFIDKEETA